MRKTLVLKDSAQFRRYTLKDILTRTAGLFDRTSVIPDDGCAEYLESSGLGKSCGITEESIHDLVSSGGMVMYWDISVFPGEGEASQDSTVLLSSREGSALSGSEKAMIRSGGTTQYRGSR